MTTDPTLVNGMGVPSTVKTGRDEAGHKETKDYKSGDMWLDALESKTQIPEDIPEVIPEEGVDKACGCVARNFWNCSAREVMDWMDGEEELGPSESDYGTTVAVLGCGGL